MGIVGFLQFALKCVDLFAWPIFALAYPLFASIRAIETNSYHHMRKLVTYWILFSLISLCEHNFDKFIEWFPLWAYIKIVAVCWLVLPCFGHSYNAYKSLLLLCSYVNLQVINWSNKQDREPFLKTQETFLSVAEKFIKENGSEALEELIAKKSKVAIPAKEKMAVTIAEKKEIATTIEGAKPDVEQITTPANTEKKEKATKIMVSKPNVDADKKMAVTITEKKEMATAIEGAKPDVEQIKAPANTEKKEKPTKNKSKVAEPNLDPKEKMAVPTPLLVISPKSTITEPKEMAKAIESKGAKPDVEEIKAPANTEEKEKATKIKSEGAKPNFDAEEIKVANTEKEEIAAIEVKCAKANLVEAERRKAEVVEVKEMNYCPSSSDKVQTQWICAIWTCDICHVTTMSQITLYSHFQSKEHLAKRPKLKAKKQTPKNNNSSSYSTTEFQRDITELGISLSNAFTALKTIGIVKSLDPSLAPVMVTKGWKPNAFCDYHQTPGHKTDDCFLLKNVIKGLIKSQRINVDDLSRITKSAWLHS